MTPTAPSLAVVIPTLDEATTLPLLLADLHRLTLTREVVVTDGGSRDGTVALARTLGARVVRGEVGRARQIRAGVEVTEAPWILLLHADSRFTSECAGALEHWLRGAPSTDSAYFRFALQGRDPFWRFLEVGQSLRERLWGLVYGDQGLLLSRQSWEAVGGVPDLPLMEDVALVDRVRRQGVLHRLDASLPTSPRRYVQEGRLSGWVRNTLLVSLYRVGVPPRHLAPLYSRRAGRGPSEQEEGASAGEEGRSSRKEGRWGTKRSGTTEGRSGRQTAGSRWNGKEPGGTTATVVVFARAPRPGRVKTRLAAGVGHDAALRIYRRMGRDLVDELASGPWTLTVAYTPAEGRMDVEPWLAGADRYWPQGDGDLGVRMARALDEALRDTGKAVVVGTDAPDLDRELVTQAVRALDDHDLVLVPALDGGYVLLGLRKVHPALFRNVAWSTGRVLRTTLERADRLGLRVRLLPAVADVDTADDVPDRYLDLLERPSFPP